MTSGSLSGTGILDGVEFSLESNANHNPQAGIGANAFDVADLGFSMWFYWTRVDDTVVDGYTIASGRYKGDINADLTAVPLPAAGWL